MKSCARMLAVVLIGSSMAAPLLRAEDAPSPRPKHHPSTPKVEVFLGYSHFRGTPTLSAGNRMVGLNGGNASIAFNFSRYFGVVADVGGYNDSELRLTAPGIPARQVDADGKVYTYLFGPRFAFRNSSRLTPFAQVLFGGAHASEVTISGCSGPSCTPLPEQDSFAATAGGGLDIRIFRHVSIRAVQAEYMMTRFADVASGANHRQNDLRLSTGLVFPFGGKKTAAPVAVNSSPVATCSTKSKTIYAGSGDWVIVRAQASDPDGDPLTYNWSTTGGTIDGSGSEVHWMSSGTTPGTYRVDLRVDDGRGGVANCSADVRVDVPLNQSPTMSCSADRTSVRTPDPVELTATASDPDNDPLTYSWSSSNGQVIGTGSSVKYDTTGLATGQYSVTAHASDGRGGTADCSVTLDVRAPTALEARLALHSIYFPTAQTSAERPNGGLLASQRQTLIELAADFEKYLETTPDAHLILEGHSDPRGSVEYNQALSERRVNRTKRFLIEHGVPEANLETKAFGLEQNLTDAQVKEAIDRNPELTPLQRQKLLDNMATIYLASNRRVDVTLTTTGQHSMRQYPFNASDSLSLLQKERSEKATPAQRKKN